MKFLLRCTLTLVITFIIISLAIISLGQATTYPSHPLDVALALCDGQPCMLDMTIGKSRWEDISAFSTLSLNQRREQRDTHVAVGVSTSAHIFRSVDGEHVGRGTLHLNEQQKLPIGWVVTWYGQPCGLSYYPRYNDVVIRYPHTLVNVKLIQGYSLTPFSPVANIQWQDAAFQNEMQPDICVDNITDGVINSEWRGFTLRLYND